jgi:hypothetical protein
MTTKPTTRLTAWLRAIVKFFAIEDPYNLRVAPFYGMGKSYRGRWPKRVKLPRAVQVLARQAEERRKARLPHGPAL